MSFENKQQQPQNLAHEAKELKFAVEELELQIAAGLKEAGDPKIIQQALHDLETSVDQHNLRIQQLAQDVTVRLIDIYEEGIDEKIDSAKDVIRKMLGENLELIMLHTLYAEHMFVRAISAEALQGSESEETLRYLREVVLVDSNNCAREAAAEALLHTKDPLSIKALRELGLTDEDPRVRLQSVISLSKTTDPECLRDLLELIRDTDAGVRDFVAMTLQETKDPDILNHLRELALSEKVEDFWPRQSAVKTLEGTQDPECRAALKFIAEYAKDEDLLRMAWEALGETTDVEFDFEDLDLA